MCSLAGLHMVLFYVRTKNFERKKCMGLYEVCLVGVGLSMDAVAVSMSVAMAHPRNRAKLFEMGCLFAAFQGIMPLIGYFIGGVFSEVVTRMGSFLVLFILAFIGYKMLRSGFSEESSCTIRQKLTHKLLLIQAVATSIDALAVGVGFHAQQVDIVLASLTIAVTTLLLSGAAIAIGKSFGDILGKKAEIFGGVLLIVIGIKAVL